MSWNQQTFKVSLTQSVTIRKVCTALKNRCLFSYSCARLPFASHPPSPQNISNLFLIICPIWGVSKNGYGFITPAILHLTTSGIGHQQSQVSLLSHTLNTANWSASHQLGFWTCLENVWEQRWCRGENTSLPPMWYAVKSQGQVCHWFLISFFWGVFLLILLHEGATDNKLPFLVIEW